VCGFSLLGCFFKDAVTCGEALLALSPDIIMGAVLTPDTMAFLL
jgi:hypothetical protein